MSFWPIPARAASVAAFAGLLCAHWYSPLTSATVAVGVLYTALVATR